MSRLSASLLILLGSGLSCKDKAPETKPAGEAPAQEASEPESAAVDDSPLGQARAAAKELGGALKGRLMAALKEGGPDRAVEVCSLEAQDITGVVRARGIEVGRSSLRLRNPKNAEAPGWVREWLESQGERPAEGLEPVATMVEGRARVLIPIPVEPACLMCHGKTESLPPGVRKILSERYPGDAATGYEVGDLRGALWAQGPAAESP